MNPTKFKEIIEKALTEFSDTFKALAEYDKKL